MNALNKTLLTTLVSGSLAFAGVTLWEGTRYTPYNDIVGVLTVCEGYTGKDIVKDKRYTRQECDKYLNRELQVHARGILNCIKVPLEPHQFHAFVLFAYNVGVNAFCTSNSVLKPLNQGNYAAACKGMLKWTYAGGKYVKGLANRRAYEYKMCIGEMNGTTKTAFDSGNRLYLDSGDIWIRNPLLYRPTSLESFVKPRTIIRT